MMAIYTDVVAFKAGTFSLFTPAAELEAQAQKRGVSLVVHPGRHLSRDEMVYEFREGSTVFLDDASFEVAEVDSEYVTLRDVSFPLIASRYTRAELSDLLRRDTRNDYLLVEPVEVAGEQQTQDVVNNPVPTVQNQSEEKPEESEQSTEHESEREPEPETERQRERESGEGEPAPEPEQESEGQDPLYTFEPYRVEDVEQTAEEEEEEEPPYEVVLAPTVELVGLFAIFSRLNDDFVRDGEDIRAFETQEEAQAFIDALMHEEPTVDAAQQEPEPEPTPVSVPVHSEVQEKLNYHITDDALGTGGPKAKFQRNLAAIELVHRLEREGRMATAEEQEVLAQYVGWGGIAQAFDEHNDAWSEEYQKLKSELTPEEYAAARGSTLNAHYTSPAVIREMYAGLERMGFAGGNLLEPAMGVGNFFGMIPDSLAGSTRLYGVELDEITGKIAKQLYQQADIAVKGFEKTDFSNDFFDVVIGNVPFGNYQVSDRAYDRHHFMIHDFFLAKSLDKVRPGGVVAVITSVGTLDKKDEAPRRYLAERANLLAMGRLWRFSSSSTQNMTGSRKNTALFLPAATSGPLHWTAPTVY